MEGPSANPTVHAHTVNGVNEYLTWSLDGSPVGPAPDYDDAGNMTTDPMGWNHWAGPNGLKYEYDEENRLTSVRVAAVEGPAEKARKPQP